MIIASSNFPQSEALIPSLRGPFSAGGDLAEVSAFDIDNGSAAQAFHLRMRAQPADALARLIGAVRANDAYFVVFERSVGFHGFVRLDQPMTRRRLAVASSHSTCVVVDPAPRFGSRFCSDGAALTFPLSEGGLMRVQAFHVCAQDRAQMRLRFAIVTFDKKAFGSRSTAAAMDQSRANFG
ncbi:hypothetical protein RFN28_19655 [Mesorhizobium sp. VK24D]|uniref:Uncharacterized protein n=1 Tax=Mesorhizobium album TaxID=3072314 RepID=A0ABU4Y139_9HYPH|nr:hypothetical protein [Mesorhizobium sp. VK24D]MDX8480664.1 hypothetical protein [Mesorhizobium sp. VK24D]